jgi:ribosomal protein S18 acetylase RimI-like enzyme
MLVRLATDEDATAIAYHNIALAQESEGYTLTPKISLKGVMMLVQQAEKGFYLVAEDGGVVVGQLLVTFEWSDWRAQDIWWLQSIYVKPSWRRQGVMQQLIATVFAMAQKQDICELRLYVHRDNRVAIEAYKHIHMQKLPYHLFSLSVSANR